MKPKEVSPHKLSLFRKCRKLYYFEYLDPEIAKIKDQIKKKRPPLEMGNFVHDSLTLFFKEPLERRSWETMSEILKNLWSGPRGKEYGFLSIEDERAYYYEALSMLKWFVKNENLNPNIYALPISPPGKSYDDYLKVPFAEEFDLGGKIDRIDLLEDGTLEIIDYKTGKPEDNFLQLLIYVFLAEGLFGKKVSKARNLYLKSGTEGIIVPDEGIKQRAKNDILQIVETIGLEELWDPNISKLCAFCDYLDYCPAKEEIKKFLGEKISS